MGVSDVELLLVSQRSPSLKGSDAGVSEGTGVSSSIEKKSSNSDSLVSVSELSADPGDAGVSISEKKLSVTGVAVSMSV